MVLVAFWQKARGILSLLWASGVVLQRDGPMQVATDSPPPGHPHPTPEPGNQPTAVPAPVPPPTNRGRWDAWTPLPSSASRPDGHARGAITRDSNLGTA